MIVDLNKDIPDKFIPLLFNESRFLIMKGSAGSGKSVFATKKLVFRSIYEGRHRHLLMRKVSKDLKESIFEEVKERISEWGLRNRVYYHENNSDLKIYLKDSEFIFKGIDDPERIKSISKITTITLEELTEFDEDDFDQVNLRLRGETSFYKQTMAMFNPIDENHWVKKRFVDDPPKDISLNFHESTYLDNNFLDEDYKKLLESYQQTNELYYQVYCLGDWGVVDKSNKFLYKFDKKLHIKESVYNEDLPIKLSFDFNIDPMTVQVYQREGKKIWFFDKIRLNNADIYDVCDHIKAEFPNKTLIVTGDASGKNRTAATRGKKSFWQIIKDELRLKDFQIKLRGKNLDLISSRILCNSVLKFCEVTIDPKLKELINDCTFAKVDDHGELIKDRKENKNDDLDGFRYALDCEFPEIIGNPKKYK